MLNQSLSFCGEGIDCLFFLAVTYWAFRRRINAPASPRLAGIWETGTPNFFNALTCFSVILNDP